MSPLILVPAYNAIDWRLHDAIGRSGIPMLAVYGCSDLVKVRSQMLSDALRSSADRFIFIDSDIIPSPEQIWQLVESEKLNAESAVSGCYAGRDGALAAQLESQEPFTLSGGARFVECFAAGMGFSAVHRDTVELIRNELPELTTGQGVEWRAYFLPLVIADRMNADAISYLSEDWAFWWRVRNLGKAAFWIDTNLCVGHLHTAPRALHPDTVILPHNRDRGAFSAPQ